MENFKKGQVVYLKSEDISNLNKIYEGVIDSVGRKFLTVSVKGIQFKFYKDTLGQVTNYAQDYSLYISKEKLLNEIESKEILNDLRLKLGLSSYSESELSLEQLRRIKSIINENDTSNIGK